MVSGREETTRRRGGLLPTYRTGYKIQESAVNDFKIISSRHHGPLLPYFEVQLENSDKVKYVETFSLLNETRLQIIREMEADIRIRQQRIDALHQEVASASNFRSNC